MKKMLADSLEVPSSAPSSSLINESTSVGSAVIRLIRSYGINTVFGIPGTHNLEFYRDLNHLGMRAVTTRHEQGAGYAADGWAQLTGLPGVVIVTSGPGLLNVLSAAGTGYCESRPMVILSPGAPLGMESSNIGALHESKDPVAASAAVLEWSVRALDASQALRAIHRAFDLFWTGRPRPVHLEVPLDVLESPVGLIEPELLFPRPQPAPAPANTEKLTTAISLLRDAQRPVIIAGGGALASESKLTELAESLGAPVLTSLNGKGVVSGLHRLSLGSELRLNSARSVAEEADVLLIIGSKVGDAERWFTPLAAKGQVIRIDRLDSQMQVNVPVHLTLRGDSAAIVPQLLAGVSERTPASVDYVSEAKAQIRAESREVAPEIARLTETIAAAIPENAILTGDSSQITYLGTASFIPRKIPRSFLYTPTYATLGYGLPAAIGAKIAHPERPVISVLGDGALMFSVQEFATAVEQKLDLVVVCVDNGGYGEIRQNEIGRGIRPIGVDLVQPDWAGLVRAFGGDGEQVCHAEDLAPAISRAFDAGGVRIVHIRSEVFATRS